MVSRKALSAFLLFLCVATLAAAKYESSFNPDYNLSELRTFDFQKQTRTAGEAFGRLPLAEARIRSALEQALEKKGYERLENGEPDFLVAFNALLQHQRTTTTSSYGLGGWGNEWGTVWDDDRTEDYEEGTLIVDIVDNEGDQDALVWRGRARARVQLYSQHRQEGVKAARKLIDRFVKDVKKQKKQQ